MAWDEQGLTIEELAKRADVPVRTVRFYITERLLPGPGARGRDAVYGEEHLLRLLLVRRLSERGQRLAQIREYLDRLTLDELRALLAEDAGDVAALEAAAREPSPRAFVGELLRRARMVGKPAPVAAPGPAPAAPNAPPPSGAPLAAPAWPEPLQAPVAPSAPTPSGLPSTAPAGEPNAPLPTPLAAPPAAAPVTPLAPSPAAAPASTTAPSPPTAPPSATTEAPGASAWWRRILLAPGVELHVRLDPPPDPHLVQRLVRAAGLPPDTVAD